MQVEVLGEILARNYSALGWKLNELERLPSPGDRWVLRGKITCPCGGMEYFNMLCSEDMCEVDLAREILRRTASRKHLQQDVDRGVLPAMEIDKHCFDEVLL